VQGGEKEFRNLGREFRKWERKEKEGRGGEGREWRRLPRVYLNFP